MDTEERLAVFIDYENLALGAREHLGGMEFDFGPIADALAVRGRVIVRRAYADWSYFDEDRRKLTRHQVDLIEMPQRMGSSRKNAADIKMVVDAIEMAFERDYISTFVLCTGDSDFSPLVHKLREVNKRVIGVGVENSTSRLLPAACDEFLFYDRLEGVDVPDERPSTSSEDKKPRRGRKAAAKTPTPAAETQPEAGPDAGADQDLLGKIVDALPDRPTQKTPRAAAQSALPSDRPEQSHLEPQDDDVPELPSMEVRVAQTLANLQQSTSADVTASMLKRTLVRKDPTFSEADYGFRTFGEFLRFLEERDFVQLSDGPTKGDPHVNLPASVGAAESFALVKDVVAAANAPVLLSSLKNKLRKRRPDFSEKALGYRGFLQFCRAAADAETIVLTWDDAAEDYIVTVA